MPSAAAWAAVRRVAVRLVVATAPEVSARVVDPVPPLTVAEAVTRSAIERKESRGAQFREDYPSKDAAFGKVNIAVRKDADGTMKVNREPIPEMPAELKQVIEEMG